MARENNQVKPHVPVYGNGLVPTYFSGSAVGSGVRYSRRAKLAGFLLLVILIAIVTWATLGIAGII